MTLNLIHNVRHTLKPSNGKPPLLILLHGVGSNEHDLFGLTPYFDDRFIIAAARAPYTLQPGSYAWYHIEFVPGDFIMNEEEAESSRKLLSQFIQDATREYDADPKRVFIGGFSQGAIMSEFVSLVNPELVAGAVLMSGRTLPLLRRLSLDGAVKSLPMFVQHGEFDQVIPIKHGRDTRDFLSSLSVPFEYHEYAMAHQISEESLSDVDAWLTKQLDSSVS
jgi:phospholipase/carboxylesterase